MSIIKVRYKFNCHHLMMIPKKNNKLSKKLFSMKNNIMTKFITLQGMKITNYHFVLLYHHITMSSQNFIKEILTRYLCKIIKIIVLFILMIIRHKKLVNLYKSISMKRKYLLIKLN